MGLVPDRPACRGTNPLITTGPRAAGADGGGVASVGVLSEGLRGPVGLVILDDVIHQAHFYFFYGSGSPAAVGRA